MTKTPRAPRVCEIAADEGYNLQGKPVLLAKLTGYVGRATFVQLAQIATHEGGEYSKHNRAFMFPAGAEDARESFAAQARVILTNTAANHADAAAHDRKCRAAQRETAKHPPTELEKLQTLLANQEETLADWTDDTAAGVIHPGEIRQLKALILKTREAIAQALDDEADTASRQALQARRRADRADDPEALAAEDRAESADYTARQYAAGNVRAVSQTIADRIAARYPGIASHVSIVRPAATPYTDAPTVETPPAIRVSTSRPIRSTMTNRTPAGYGPSQAPLF